MHSVHGRETRLDINNAIVTFANAKRKRKRKNDARIQYTAAKPPVENDTMPRRNGLAVPHKHDTISQMRLRVAGSGGRTEKVETSPEVGQTIASDRAVGDDIDKPPDCCEIRAGAIELLRRVSLRRSSLRRAERQKDDGDRQRSPPLTSSSEGRLGPPAPGVPAVDDDPPSPIFPESEDDGWEETHEEIEELIHSIIRLTGDKETLGVGLASSRGTLEASRQSDRQDAMASGSPSDYTYYRSRATGSTSYHSARETNLTSYYSTKRTSPTETNLTSYHSTNCAMSLSSDDE